MGGIVRHISWKPAALAAFVAAAALTPARAQTPEFEKARAALAQAAVARAEALKALEAADVAIKAAQAALGEASTTPAPPIPSREPPMKSNRDLNEDRLAVIGASRCLADVNSAEAIARKAQRYAEECLEFDEFRDYSVSNLNTKFNFGSGSDFVEVVPSVSFYRRYPIDKAQTFAFNRRTLKFGVVVPTDKEGGTTGAFANLGDAQPFKSVGLVWGFEYGLGSRATVSDMTASVQKMLAGAQRDCVADAKSSQLRTSATTVEMQAALDAAALSQCTGAALNVWMANEKRRNVYWSAIDKDMWGKAPKNEFYFGFEGRLFRFAGSYYALTDPGRTGIALRTDSVFAGSALNSNAVEEFSSDRFSLKGYAGGTAGDFGWGGSLSYRRLADFPRGTKDQTLCPPGSVNFQLCSKANIAPPFHSDGWVVGGRLAGIVPQLGFLPRFGVEGKISYALDIKQIGIDVPVYLLADDKGTATGGVRFGCTNDGTTAAGYVIKGECKASFFIGTSFAVRGIP